MRPALPRLLLCGLLVAGLTACASAPNTPEGSTDPAPATTRTVVQAEGDVEIPTDPSRLVALDEYAGLELLALGQKPDLVFGTLQSTIGQSVLRSAGVEVRDDPSFLTAPDLEKVVTARPDVLVVSGAGPLPGMFTQLNAIAPTVVVPYTQSWRDIATATGKAFGREQEAATVIERIDARTAALHDRVAAKPMSMSVLLGFQGSVFTVASETPAATLLKRAGITRPAPEQNPTPDADPTVSSITTETLAAHDADVVAVLTGGQYDSATIQGAPTFASLAPHAITVDGDSWFGSHPFAISWILDDLDALTSGKGQAGIGVPGDAAARWATFEASVK